jgi:hypothetical protein
MQLSREIFERGCEGGEALWISSFLFSIGFQGGKVER